MRSPRPALLHLTFGCVLILLVAASALLMSTAATAAESLGAQPSAMQIETPEVGLIAEPQG